jgi:hypothetical protein
MDEIIHRLLNWKYFVVCTFTAIQMQILIYMKFVINTGVVVVVVYLTTLFQHLRLYSVDF